MIYGRMDSEATWAWRGSALVWRFVAKSWRANWIWIRLRISFQLNEEDEVVWSMTESVINCIWVCRRECWNISLRFPHDSVSSCRLGNNVASPSILRLIDWQSLITTSEDGDRQADGQVKSWWLKLFGIHDGRINSGQHIILLVDEIRGTRGMLSPFLIHNN